MTGHIQNGFQLHGVVWGFDGIDEPLSAVRLPDALKDLIKIIDLL